MSPAREEVLAMMMMMVVKYTKILEFIENVWETISHANRVGLGNARVFSGEGSALQLDQQQ